MHWQLGRCTEKRKLNRNLANIRKQNFSASYLLAQSSQFHRTDPNGQQSRQMLVVLIQEGQR